MLLPPLRRRWMPLSRSVKSNFANCGGRSRLAKPRKGLPLCRFPGQRIRPRCGTRSHSGRFCRHPLRLTVEGSCPRAPQRAQRQGRRQRRRRDLQVEQQCRLGIACNWHGDPSVRAYS